MTSKCGKNKKVFLPHFDVICDLLLNRRTVIWNLFVLYNKELIFNIRRGFSRPTKELGLQNLRTVDCLPRFFNTLLTVKKILSLTEM